VSRSNGSGAGLRIALGADHAGFATKAELFRELTDQGYKVIDFGTHSEESCDYPDFAVRVGKAVASGRCDRGILACGSGIGMAITANKVKGVRAATPWSVKVARLSAQHNSCNVLCVAGRFSTLPSIKRIVRAWLATPFEGGRHQRRIEKIRKIEAKA
jgi:ribose 5-phosphate isomerase B